MKRKDEVLAKFKIFKNDNKVEACEQRILMLKSNNGGKYTSVAFTNFCQAHGI
jgi:hypothetical protein